MDGRKRCAQWELQGLETPGLTRACVCATVNICFDRIHLLGHVSHSELASPSRAYWSLLVLSGSLWALFLFEVPRSIDHFNRRKINRSMVPVPLP